ncbi:killer cell lectin-like receptor subfamily B member 1B allele C isoform X1 [Chrysemys picta bellii]|uniref:killer cell lectin-like receptor subfamily B member 1B allele C isoform X1 n=1 Tax=Chrysemys picta bellii TaxID=8478 RepID=UPI0032B1EA79
MTGEIVYADLNVPSEWPCLRPPQASQHLDLPLQPRWQRVTLWVGWVTSVILGMAVIALGIWVFQLVSEKGQPRAAPGGDRSGNRNTCEAECGTCLEDFRSQLKGSLCHPNQHGSANGSGCKLCPATWLLHRDKCYWVSGKMKPWNESRDDCSAKHSQLLVIRDWEEMEIITNSTQGSTFVWIGLSLSSRGKTWIWLNGSQLNQTLFPLPVQDNGNSCGVVKGNQIQSDTCATEYEWICQREAVLI